MGKIYIFLADGLEEIEGLTVVDILRRGGMNVQTVSITQSRQVTGSHAITIQTDSIFSETDFSDALMYVLPGGMPGTLNLGEHEGLRNLLLTARENEIKVGAICAAPSVLGDLGLLKGKEAACYPGFEPRLSGAVVSQDPVVVSDGFITSRGMGTAIPFALTLLSELTDAETAEKIAASIIWKK